MKQSGGHGQFAIADIEVEPIGGGDAFEFVDKIVGGAVPRQFIPSVEKGLRAQMERGVGAGYPVVGLRVTLVDGKAHSVDSSDLAFQVAGGLALKEAAKAAEVLLLEPVAELAVLVADDYVGAVMSDLSARRGRVSGTEPVGSTGRTLVRAGGAGAGDRPICGGSAFVLPGHRHLQPALPTARAHAGAPRRESDGGARRRSMTPAGQPVHRGAASLGHDGRRDHIG